MIPQRLRIVNVGIRLFYNAAVDQHAEVVHVNWQPSELEKEIEELLERIGG